ncbi:MAG: hypothetical protein Q8Q01_02560 [archaeon]|nr:hypothetical protein [archaeon]
MKQQHKSNLLKKGWTVREINKAESIIEQKGWYDVHFSKIVFWSALVVIVFANVIVSLVMIPFLIVLNSWVLFSITVLLAGMIGFLYNFLITDIGHLEHKHHLMATIIVPAVALINLFVVVITSNSLIEQLGAGKSQNNPWLIAIVFAVAFTIPALGGYLRRIKESKKAALHDHY